MQSLLSIDPNNTTELLSWVTIHIILNCLQYTILINDDNSKLVIHLTQTTLHTHTHSHIHISVTVPGVVVISIVLTGSVELSVGSTFVKLINVVDIVLGVTMPTKVRNVSIDKMTRLKTL